MIIVPDLELSATGYMALIILLSVGYTFGSILGRVLYHVCKHLFKNGSDK